ncbi:MAG TPA: hypothetical protein VGM64_14500 [Lacunisphaera sp.]|jgi:O-antigen/teichoic acid export membrane protein
MITFLKRMTSSHVVQNVISNYVTVVWLGALSIVTVPIYLKVLGSGQWSIVAACLTMQGFLGLMDVGFSQLLPRALARVAGDRKQEIECFEQYTRIYLILAAGGVLVAQMVISAAAQHWFKVAQADVGMLELTLRIMTVQFFFQFANNANIGFWYGLQLQKRANFRQCVFATMRHTLAIVSVFCVQRSALSYIIPFGFFAFIEWLANSYAIRNEWLVPGNCGRRKYSYAKLYLVVKEAGGLTFGIFIGMLVGQLDRMVLSSSLEIKEYGYYVIVANFGMAFNQLQHPLMRAFFPRIAREESTKNLGWSSGKGLLMGVLALCVFPCTMVAVWAPEILHFWLRNDSAVSVGILPFRLILAAVALNSIYNVVYQKIIARGRTRVVFVINITSLVITSGVAYVFMGRIGAGLGGLIWISNSTIQLTAGLVWLKCAARPPSDVISVGKKISI